MLAKVSSNCQVSTGTEAKPWALRRCGGLLTSSCGNRSRGPDFRVKSWSYETPVGSYRPER